MLQLDDLDEDFLSSYVDLGRDWFWAHRAHVLFTVKKQEDCPCYPPSGSDIFKPELWKPAHWNFFLKNYLGDK